MMLEHRKIKIYFVVHNKWYNLNYMVEQTAALPAPKLFEGPKDMSLSERMARAAREVADIDRKPIEPLRVPLVRLKKDEMTHMIVSPETNAEVRAVFLPSAVTFFENCGLDVSRIDPVPMGEGLNHIVFSYANPDGRKQVVKVSKPETIGLQNNGRRDESENITLIKKYFSQFAVPTEIRSDPSTGKYLVLQDEVHGDPITNKSHTPNIDRQLSELMRCNSRLMKDTGHTMDFFGVPGFFSWARHQFRQFFVHNSTFEISNLILDPEGKIRIIDYDMLRFRNSSPRQKIVYMLGYTANKIAMKAYFGLDMKPKE